MHSIHCGLTNLYSTLSKSRSYCSLHCRSFGHAWMHPLVIDALYHWRVQT